MKFRRLLASLAALPVFLAVVARVGLAQAPCCQDPAAPSGAEAHKSPATGGSADAGAPPKDVAATINGRIITGTEVDALIAAQVYGLQQRIYALRRKALESLIDNILIEENARAEGITAEELKKRLFPENVEISQAEVEKVYASRATVYAAYNPDEAKRKIRRDLENLAKTKAYQAALVALRDRARVDIRLAVPQPPLVSVSDSGPSQGPADAPVTIVEFSDFECPYCKQEAATLHQLLQAYPGKIRVVFKQTPLPIHARAFRAAQASVCAAQQGKFWPYHDKLFAASDLSEDALRSYAVQVGLSARDFDQCLSSDASAASVARDVQEARTAGVQMTPAFVINGKMLQGLTSLEVFKKEIDAAPGKRLFGKVAVTAKPSPSR